MSSVLIDINNPAGHTVVFTDVVNDSRTAVKTVVVFRRRSDGPS